MNRQVEGTSRFRGAFGATTTERLPVSRSEGGAFRAEIYTTINVAEDPELEEELVEGTLNEVEDPETGATYRPAVPVRYHDPEAGVFVLVVPESLRHREFALRSELLQELADAETDVPDYVSGFEVVFDPRRVEEIEATGTGSGAHPSAPAPSESASADDELDDVRAELEREREELEQRRRELDTREQQLDEVEERIDREREQMDEFEEELVEEREELDEMRRELERRAEELESERQELEAEKLNLEETRRQMDKPEERESEEDTQVVTDDQLVEVSSADEVVDEESDVQVEEMGAPKTTNQQWDAAGELDAVQDVEEVESFAAEVDEERIAGAAGAEDAPEVKVVDGGVVATCRLEDDRMARLTDDAPALFVQYHGLADYPVAALCIASLDDEGDVEASYGWPLNLDDDADRGVFRRLTEEFEVDVGIYDGSGNWVRGFQLQAPLEENVAWIRDRVDEVLEERDELGDFDRAAEQYRDPDFERIGSMQHSFDREAFRELETASQVKLAAGVLGFWSSDEMVEYLASNRSYPLDRFRDLQLEVVESALDIGIFLEEPLRELAIDQGYAADDVELAERLLANFAEVCVQLKSNDLEPVDEWENWDALIEFAQGVGVTPDPDVVELAEASLKRARDFQETKEAGGVPEAAQTPDSREATQKTAQDFVEDPDSVDVDELVVSKRSESTGVTYFLPDEAVIDTFDDLDELPREDLEKLLDDANGRLEAAQMLIERFGGDSVADVLEAAEEMAAPEVTALARFIESKADVLEPELVRAVESAGPSATFVATRALAEIESTSALPTLLEAFRTDEQEANRRGMARALASYGEKLVAPLARSIQQEGVDDDVRLLIQCLEEASDAAVEQLADHRDDSVREAVETARDRNL